MPQRTVQVITTPDSGLPRDFTVNTFTFTGSAGNDDGLAQDVLDAYTDNLHGVIAGFSALTTKVYDALSAPPNPPLAVRTAVDNQFGLTSGPREVALCMSFKGSPALSGRPPGLLATERGRVFLGPINTQYISENRPAIEQMGLGIFQMADAIAAAGGAGYVWSCGSDLVQVSDVYIDNEWDTQRRRGFRPTNRVTHNV